MRLVDTSIWIELLLDSAIGRNARSEVPSPQEWLVPTIVQFELAKWLTRELDRDTANRVIALTRTYIVVELDTEIALRAAELSARHKLPTADALIYATALVEGADLLTCDSHFKELEQVHFIPKLNS